MNISLIFTALKWLHSVDNDPSVQDALTKAQANGSIDWQAMLAAIGHAVYVAVGSPSIATIVGIIMSFAHPVVPSSDPPKLS